MFFYPTSLNREAAWAVTNLTISGAKDQVRVLIEAGAIEPMCRLLFVSDSQVVHVALDGLNNILKSLAPDYQSVADQIEACGGLDQIETLQTHENEDIYSLAFEIVDKYYSGEAEEDADIVPHSTEGVFEFSQPPLPNQGFKF